MRALHVAAMPFPTAQGTQAAVFAMAHTLGEAGHDIHLLTYGRGSMEKQGSFTLHRAPDLPGPDAFRSGPSLRKIAQDALLAGAVSRLAGELRPDVVVAHHVEAQAACLAARVRPLWFFAHTSLHHELPTYFPSLAARIASTAGRHLDTTLAKRADRVLAIAPSLTEDFRAHHVNATFVPLPWEPHADVEYGERRAARAHLRIPIDAQILLYAGNLDSYQGWETALTAAATVARNDAPTLYVLVATESDPAPLFAHPAAHLLGHRLRITPLAGDETRRRVFAAADVAVVPRRSPGGLPIKLLEALAHGIPVVAEHRAAAGLPLEDAVALCRDDDPDAMAEDIRILLRERDERQRLAEAGRQYLRTHHSREAFLNAMVRPEHT